MNELAIKEFIRTKEEKRILTGKISGIIDRVEFLDLLYFFEYKKVCAFTGTHTITSLTVGIKHIYFVIK